ncbi:MAG: ferredoxin family protein [Planctomycetales bacterium]
MSNKITVILSQGQSNHPAKRKLEEELLAALLVEPDVNAAVIPHLYDLTTDDSGMLCLRNVSGNMMLLSWLFPRAAHWILDRNNIKGRFGATLMKSVDADDEEDGQDEPSQSSPEPDESRGVGARNVPDRSIHCLDLRAENKPEPYLAEIRRVASESSVQTVSLGFSGGSPSPVDELLSQGAVSQPGNANGAASANIPLPANAPSPANGKPQVESAAARRWYPVIDYSRCTNCMECLDFCLFGVYGVDRADSILVEQPDECKKGCPACSRVCPENAIIFPQHKAPDIAGSPTESAGGLKIDLSRLFGAGDADPMQTAVAERDRELVADGREAVGAAVGVPKRQQEPAAEPRDELDDLMDELEDLEL